MLAKLIKYELKATSRLLIPLYLIMLFMSLINRFIYFISYDSQILDVVKIFFYITYVMSILAVIIVTFIYMVVRFYKNLLTDEGYLMFTIPVKAHQLISSKLITTLFWSIISIAGVLLSLLIAFASVHNLSEVVNVMRQGYEDMDRVMGGGGAVMLIELGAMFILGMISQILFIYVSIAIGQLFTKHKIIGSFVAYIVIYTGLQFAAMFLMIPFGLYFSNTQPEPSIIPHVIFPIALVFLAGGSACCYAVTNYIFKRKLNLE